MKARSLLLLELETQVQILDEVVYVSLCITWKKYESICSSTSSEETVGKSGFYRLGEETNE